MTDRSNKKVNSEVEKRILERRAIIPNFKHSNQLIGMKVFVENKASLLKIQYYWNTIIHNLNFPNHPSP
jgi:hypothetical protein